MHHLSLATAVTALLALNTVTANRQGSHIVHERREESSSWLKLGSVHSAAVLPMRIGLTQQNLNRGGDLLTEVSDPTSPLYGKYYTAEEIHTLFAPSDDSVASVLSWLETGGIARDRVSQSTNKQWLQFDAQVVEVESLLKTSYYYYEHVETGRASIGCDEYHIHEDTLPHIDYITPGVKFLGTKSFGPSQKRSSDLESHISMGGVSPSITSSPFSASDLAKLEASDNLTYCYRAITPKCIAGLYNISAPTTAVPGNNLGIFEEGNYLDPSDMQVFYNILAPQIPKTAFPIVHNIDGANNSLYPEKAGAEACLDFQIAYPIIWPQQTVLFQTDDHYYAFVYSLNESHGIFNTFLDAIDGSYCNYSAFGETGDSPLDPTYPDPRKGGYKGQLQCGVYKPTNVISLSYGIDELETLPFNYQKRQCSEYMKLGMQGISVVFASGDFGVSCARPHRFNPLFPANCPYVTSVGATSLPSKKSAELDEEVASTQFASGGGFSNVFARPSYQEKAVKAFFSAPNAPTFPYYNGSSIGDGYYNRSGRGSPDVSAVGQQIPIIVKGRLAFVYGTSASTPIWASILTRINEERIKAGKPTVGFVNPILYQNPQVFHDITVGNNKYKYCKVIQDKGFTAGPGWDPVTGLGTPNYPALLDLFMKA